MIATIILSRKISRSSLNNNHYHKLNLNSLAISLLSSDILPWHFLPKSAPFLKFVFKYFSMTGKMIYLNNLRKIRIPSFVYISLDSSLIILVWVKKGLFLLKIFTLNISNRSKNISNINHK